MRKNNTDYINLQKYTNNEKRKIYSDHNSILSNLDFETPTKEERPKKIITKKWYKRYRTIIEEENISKLLKIRRPPGKLQQMLCSNKNFHKNCTKNKNKKSKERYQRATKNPQKIERRIVNHRRTSWKDTNIRDNKNIERTYHRKI